MLAALGRDGISGLALVSGDVHRQRLIIHPTKALLGYDVPEFISSPLAQNPLDSNKVDLPGLEFDAGEGASALLLTADRKRLTARFIAGDGRECYVREFELPDLRR